MNSYGKIVRLVIRREKNFVIRRINSQNFFTRIVPKLWRGKLRKEALSQGVVIQISALN